MAKLFPFDLESEELDQLINSFDENEKLFFLSVIKTFIGAKKIPKIALVEWDFNILSTTLKKNISKNIYQWYDEGTTCGDSTIAAVTAFTKYRLQPNYLLEDKKFNYSKTLTFQSGALGTTTVQVNTPIFVCPYGAASLYGGYSDEIQCAIGAKNANVVYSIPALTKYNTEEFATQLQNLPYMYQIYLTGDDDINTSLIERAKQSGVFAIMVTIDAGAAHGGIPMISTGSDITFSANFAGNVLSDPVFNIKCYNTIGVVSTTDRAILNLLSIHLQTLNPNNPISIEQLLSVYNKKKAFQFARKVQISGMSKQNCGIVETGPNYIHSLKHIANICHSKESVSKYIKYNITKGVPIIAKGILSVHSAKAAIGCDVDCVYVSNHGGRFLSNSIAPIDALPRIVTEVKKINKNIGVWFDGGIRCAGDILTAYANGADFVGIGRPVIYSCVLYGCDGVEAVLKQLLFFLKQQCILCGINSLDNLDQLKGVIYS